MTRGGRGGVSRLSEVGTLSPPEREELLGRCDPGGLSIRGLRSAIARLRGRHDPEVDEPHRVLERAIGIMVGREAGDHRPPEVRVRRDRGRGRGVVLTLRSAAADDHAAADLATASRVVGAVATARAAWVHQMPPVTPRRFPLLAPGPQQHWPSFPALDTPANRSRTAQTEGGLRPSGAEPA
jgi:hypothetical protein